MTPRLGSSKPTATELFWDAFTPNMITWDTDSGTGFSRRSNSIEDRRQNLHFSLRRRSFPSSSGQCAEEILRVYVVTLYNCRALRWHSGPCLSSPLEPFRYNLISSCCRRKTALSIQTPHAGYNRLLPASTTICCHRRIPFSRPGGRRTVGSGRPMVYYRVMYE